MSFASNQSHMPAQESMNILMNIDRNLVLSTCDESLACGTSELVAVGMNLEPQPGTYLALGPFLMPQKL